MPHKILSNKKEGNGMGKKLTLRVLFFGHKNAVRGICLETNISVEAKTFEGAIQKMQDATVLYMTSFSSEELYKSEYLRPASIKYKVMWSLFLFLKFLSELRKEEIDYDPQTKLLSFA